MNQRLQVIKLFAVVMTSVIAVIQLGGVVRGQTEQARVEAFAAADVVSGSARERGEAYGKIYHDRIREFLEQEIYDAFVGNPYSKEELAQYAAECGAVTREVCPLIAAECEGIAKGAGLTYDDIILINLHEELRHPAKKKKKPSHCTAVAVSPADSGDGHAYVGQTWDWMTSVAGKSQVVEWQRADGPSVLSYGFPGMPMGAGINSQGIAVCWTSATGNQTRHVGVPSFLMVGHLLAQPDLASAEREAKRNRHAGIFTFVLADAKGNLLNIEGVPGEIAVERPQERLARAYFGTRQMTHTPEGKPTKLHARCQAMYDLLARTAGKNDRETLQRYFTEREYPIVQWKSPLNKTIDIMVFDTTERKAYVTRGPDFRLEWREFGFGGK
jgi:hypothetical protein